MKTITGANKPMTQWLHPSDGSLTLNESTDRQRRKKPTGNGLANAADAMFAVSLTTKLLNLPTYRRTAYFRFLKCGSHPRWWFFTVFSEPEGNRERCNDFVFVYRMIESLSFIEVQSLNQSINQSITFLEN